MWYGSGYVTPEFRVKDMHRVVCAMKEVQPNDSAFFVLKLLVNDSLITSFHEESLKQLTFKDVKEKAIADLKRLKEKGKPFFSCMWILETPSSF